MTTAVDGLNTILEPYRNGSFYLDEETLAVYTRVAQPSMFAKCLKKQCRYRPAVEDTFVLELEKIEEMFVHLPERLHQPLRSIAADVLAKRRQVKQRRQQQAKRAAKRAEQSFPGQKERFSELVKTIIPQNRIRMNVVPKMRLIASIYGDTSDLNRWCADLEQNGFRCEKHYYYDEPYARIYPK